MVNKEMVTKEKWKHEEIMPKSVSFKETVLLKQNNEKQ